MSTTMTKPSACSPSISKPDACSASMSLVNACDPTWTNPSQPDTGRLKFYVPDVPVLIDTRDQESSLSFYVTGGGILVSRKSMSTELCAATGTAVIVEEV